MSALNLSKFSSWANPEISTILHQIANAEGRQFHAVLDEAFRDYLSKKGFVINNVALQIIGNEPRITPRRAEAQEVLSQALGAPVSVAATTSDAMGFTGRGEGVFVIANALVQVP